MRYSLSFNQLRAHDLAIRDMKITNLYSNTLYIHQQRYSNQKITTLIDTKNYIVPKKCIKSHKKNLVQLNYVATSKIKKTCIYFMYNKTIRFTTNYVGTRKCKYSLIVS